MDTNWSPMKRPRSRIFFPLPGRFDPSAIVGLSSSPIRALLPSKAHDTVLKGSRPLTKNGFFSIQTKYRADCLYTIPTASLLSCFCPKGFVSTEHGIDYYGQLSSHRHPRLLDIAAIENTAVHSAERRRLPDGVN